MNVTKINETFIWFIWSDQARTQEFMFGGGGLPHLNPHLLTYYFFSVLVGSENLSKVYGIASIDHNEKIDLLYRLI